MQVKKEVSRVGFKSARAAAAQSNSRITLWWWWWLAHEQWKKIGIFDRQQAHKQFLATRVSCASSKVH
jgi:hypothetical protein